MSALGAVMRKLVRVFYGIYMSQQREIARADPIVTPAQSDHGRSGRQQVEARRDYILLAKVSIMASRFSCTRPGAIPILGG